MKFETYGEGLAKWYRMLYAYSNLCLTYENDRLPALAGIASLFAKKLNDEYIAGLWRKDLVFGLIFKVVGEDGAFRSRIPSATVGSSWSWYSCNRRVTMRISFDNRYTVASYNDT